MFPNGSYRCVLGKCGIFFWGAHEHDAIWHLSLANVAFKNWPFSLPVLSGKILSGYNYLLDLLIFIISRTGMPASFVYFKLIPALWLVAMFWLSVVIVKKMHKTRVYLYAFLIFSLLGTSFSYFFNIYHDKTIWHSAGGIGMEASQYLINLQYAVTLPLLLLILFMMKKGSKTYLMSILAGISLAFKFYGGVVASFLVFLYICEMYLFQKKRDIIRFLFNVIILFLTLLSVVLIFYKPFQSFKSGSVLIFRPFALVHSIIEEPSRFYLRKIVLARYFLKTQGWGFKLILIELFSTGLYIFFAFGVKIMGLIFILYKLLRKKISIFYLNLLLTVIFSFSMMLIFVQKGEWWNTIQFLHYSVFLASFFFAEFLYSVFKHNRLLGVAIFALSILLISPPNIDLIRTFTSPKSCSYISSSELSALNFLKTQNDGVVLSAPYSKSDRTGRQKPYPLFASVDSAYVSALTGKSEYVSDNGVATIVGSQQCYKHRTEIVKNNICKAISQVNYVYDSHHYFNKEKLIRCKQKLSLIYDKDNVLIYKVN